MIKYVDSLLTVIEGMLEDSSSSHKQEVVVRTLGQIVASTGMVVEPYNRFPNLLMILLNMLITEPEHCVRKEVGMREDLQDTSQDRFILFVIYFLHVWDTI